MSNTIPVELPEGFIDFYKRIETWQNEMLFRLKKEKPVSKIEAAPLLAEKNQPLLEIMDMEIDPDQYKGAVMELANLVKAERGLTQDKVNRIIEVLDSYDFGDLARRMIDKDRDFFNKLARENDLALELLIFILDHALRPFLRHFALPYQDSLREEDDLVWPNGTCPVCGNQANFSRIRGEDGRRFLFCEHCFTEWEYQYLACIYCGNTEPKTIRYFVIEGDDAHQVFVCDKCRGYLKTFDERKGREKVDLFIAAIETVYLDMIAEEEGYTNNVSIDRDLN